MWTVNPNIKNGIANKAMRLFTDSHALLQHEDQHQQGAKKMNCARKYRTTEESMGRKDMRDGESVQLYANVGFFPMPKVREDGLQVVGERFFPILPKKTKIEKVFFYSWRCSKILRASPRAFLNLTL
jgi:hypothetical protein